MAIGIRGFEPGDAEFVMSLATRFSDFPVPQWRRRSEIDDFFRSKLRKAIEEPRPEEVVFIAEEDGGKPVGFVHVHPQADYFTGEKQGCISDLAVIESCEGRGVGARLLEAAEDWARTKGYHRVILYVFAENMRARQLYERHGFTPDALGYSKPVGRE